MSSNDETILAPIEDVLGKYFDYALTSETENYYEFVVTPRFPRSLDDAFSKLYDELVPKGYQPLLIPTNGMYIMRISKLPRTGRRRRLIPAILFIATVASVLITGYFSSDSFNDVMLELRRLGAAEYDIPVFINSIFFTLAVLVPIFIHELGHFVTAKKHAVPTSFPMPIPAPMVSPLGTFGAIIEMRFLPKTLKDLIKLGIAGPIAGTTLSLLIFLIAYTLSPTIPQDVALKAIKEGMLVPLPFAPLGALLITDFLLAGSNNVIIMSPAAEAAFLILIIHFANMLPIGQLDGGHVVRALTSIEIHKKLGYLSLAASLVISFLFPSLTWLSLFAVLATVLTGLRPHIGASNLTLTLTSRDKLKYGLIYLVLIAITMPIPV